MAVFLKRKKGNEIFFDWKWSCNFGSLMKMICGWMEYIAGSGVAFGSLMKMICGWMGVHSDQDSAKNNGGREIYLWINWFLAVPESLWLPQSRPAVAEVSWVMSPYMLTVQRVSCRGKEQYTRNC